MRDDDRLTNWRDEEKRMNYLDDTVRPTEMRKTDEHSILELEVQAK